MLANVNADLELEGSIKVIQQGGGVGAQGTTPSPKMLSRHRGPTRTNAGFGLENSSSQFLCYDFFCRPMLTYKTNVYFDEIYRKRFFCPEGHDE